MTHNLLRPVKGQRTLWTDRHGAYSRHLFGGGGIPPHEKVRIPPARAAKLRALNLFWPSNELQIYHRDILSVDNKHRKLFVIKQSRGCKLMPKMRLITFGGWVPPGPSGEAYASFMPPPSRNGGEGKGKRSIAVCN